MSGTLTFQCPASKFVIKCEEHLKEFLDRSDAYTAVFKFLNELSRCVKGYRTGDARATSAYIAPKLLLRLLRESQLLADETPLHIETGGARFGNRAFAEFLQHLETAEQITTTLEELLDCSCNELYWRGPRAHGVLASTVEKLGSIGPSGMESSPSADHPVCSQPSENDLINEQFAPSLKSRIVRELKTYFCHSFGDGTRLDYGSGHELNFLCFLLCLRKLGVFSTPDELDAGPMPSDCLSDSSLHFKAAKLIGNGAKTPEDPEKQLPPAYDEVLREIVLLVFTSYIHLSRRIQQKFRLEPAGSRGVWGVDDYNFLPFVFGSAQLIGQNVIRPVDAVVPANAVAHREDSLYLDALAHIFETKNGIPLGECNPVLNDISAVPFWAKIHSGFIKMYVGEVLSKLPIMQHFFFGTCIPFSPKTKTEAKGHVGDREAAGPP